MQRYTVLNPKTKLMEVKFRKFNMEMISSSIFLHLKIIFLLVYFVTLLNIFHIYIEPDSIDFPSAMAIAVRFLKKNERRSSDAFAGKGLIRFTDLPSSDALNIRRASEKRRLYWLTTHNYNTALEFIKIIELYFRSRIISTYILYTSS